jgi:hypothetical protein
VTRYRWIDARKAEGAEIVAVSMAKLQSALMAMKSPHPSWLTFTS